MQSPRVACLVPSATDLAAHLGLNIVGVSHECDHPRARGLPALTRSAIAAGPGAHAPAEIDRQVSAAAASGEPLYTVDRALLSALAPQLVLSQAICDVCAARADACDLPPGARLLELAATDIAGLIADIRAVADAADVAARGEDCIAQLTARLAAVPAGSARPRVLALEWGDPPFLGGHWVPELVERSGGHHLLAAPGQPSRRATWSEIAAADPDILVFMPCGYGLAESAREAVALCERPEIGALRCVLAGQLWATDATALFSRCTPQSVVAGVETLAAIFAARPVDPARACRITPRRPPTIDRFFTREQQVELVVVITGQAVSTSIFAALDARHALTAPSVRSPAGSRSPCPAASPSSH